MIGGKAKVFGSNARLGQGEVLVAEADESDGSFRHLFPMVAVITNIDREHMDHYGTIEALRAAFLDFANQVPFYGVVVVCADNPTAAGLPELVKRHITYGLGAGDYRGEILSADAHGTRLRVAVRGKARGEARVRMPGVHYAQNALASLCVADVFDVPFRHLRGAGRIPRRGSPLLGARRGRRRPGGRRLRPPPDGDGRDHRGRAPPRPAPGGRVPAAPLYPHRI